MELDRYLRPFDHLVSAVQVDALGGTYIGAGFLSWDPARGVHLKAHVERQGAPLAEYSPPPVRVVQRAEWLRITGTTSFGDRFLMDVRTVTRAPPTTSITSPNLGAVFTTGQQVQLSGAATSGYDLATCTATLTSSPVVAAPVLQAPVRSGTTCSFSTTLQTTAINDATWTLTMAATDVAGRVAPPTTRTFVVDDTAPDISVAGLTLTGVTRTIQTVGPSRYIAADDPTAVQVPRVSTYTARVTATDNFAVSRVVFRVDPTSPSDTGADLLFCVDGVAGACVTHQRRRDDDYRGPSEDSAAEAPDAKD
jgi:hypothetical protein